MIPDGSPRGEQRLPTSDVLRLAQAEFGLRGSLAADLIASFTEAKVKLAQATTVETHSNVYIFDENNPLDAILARERFFQGIDVKRRTHPVVFFDIPQLEAQKGAPVTRNELAAAFDAARQTYQVNQATDESNEDQLQPLLQVTNYVEPTGYNTGIGWLHKEVKTFGKPAPDERYPQIAVIYPATFQREIQNFLFPYATYHLTVLLSEEAKGEVLHDKGSPWLSKIGSSQLVKLEDDDVYEVVDLFYDVLSPNKKDQVRFLQIDYGKGKTTALRGLQRKGIPGVTCMIDLFPLSEQEDILNGQLIFVDEAITRTPEELQRIKEAAQKNEGIVVLLVPNDEVRADVEKMIKPEITQ